MLFLPGISALIPETGLQLFFGAVLFVGRQLFRNPAA